MVKLGTVMFAAIMFLFCALVYMGVSLKGVLIVYFVLLGVTSVLTLCLSMCKKKQKGGNKNA